VKAIAEIVHWGDDEKLDAGIRTHRSIPERSGCSRHIAVPVLF
jgi:hypothetical protein